MKTKYNKIGWYLNDGVVDQEAYEKGMDDCKKHNGKPQGLNPYEKDTVEWLSYNRGWNSYSPPKHNCLLENAQGMKCPNPCGECRQNVC